MKRTKLRLFREAIRVLTSRDVRAVHGGRITSDIIECGTASCAITCTSNTCAVVLP